MEMLDYSKQVRKRFDRPDNAGRLPGRTVSGGAGNEALGTRIEFDFRVSGERVEKAVFRAYGCPHAIAAASWVAEASEGQSLSDTSWLDPLSLAGLLEVPDYKLGVLLVVQDALEDAARKTHRTED